MRRVSLGWSITGAAFGLIGFVYNLMVLGAIINGVLVEHRWILLGIALCPWQIPLRSLWAILTLNCMLYALFFAGLRFAWARFRDRRGSKQGHADFRSI